jgi:putative mRNA 3-end processing factor
MPALITFTDKGLYCSKGDFYIDPWKPVQKAVITHAHSDHARPGHSHYLCQKDSLPLLRLRLGEINCQAADWNEIIYINGVALSFHPAGHIIGSAQVKISYNDETWVFSGDYKTTADGISTPFEPVRCHHFITESTFGLPIYKWKPQEQVFAEMQQWAFENRAKQISSIFIAYSLGKAQRILPALAATGIPLFAHGAVYNVQQALTNAGWNLPPVKRVDAETTASELKGAIVIAPPGAEGSPWLKRFGNYATGICSGWMMVRGNSRRKNADAGFALSDHADWEGLLEAVKATGAEHVYTTHGFQSTFSRYLRENGINATEVKTDYGHEEEDEVSNITATNT